MRAADHARVWERSAHLLILAAEEMEKRLDNAAATYAAQNAVLAGFVAQAYREEAERNPE